MTAQFLPETFIKNVLLKNVRRIKNRKGQMLTLLSLSPLAGCSHNKVTPVPPPVVEDPATFTESPTGTFTGTEDGENLDQGAATTDLTVDGLGGDDSIITGSGNDTIDGGAGNDTMQSGSGNDSLTGGAGNDIFHGGLGMDTMLGGEGDDVFVLIGTTGEGQYTQDDITNPGGSGIDLSSILTLATLNDQTISEAEIGEIIDGGAGNNTLVIYGDVDLTGLDLSNITVLQINSEATLTPDQLMTFTTVNGDGNSVLVIQIPDDGNTHFLDLSGTDFTGIGELRIVGEATITNDSFLALADVGLIRYIGTSEGDQLTGNQMDETFNGKGGDDAIAPNQGNDIIFGGNGTDTVVLGGTIDDYQLTNHGDGHWTVVGSDGTKELHDVELLSFVGSSPISLDEFSPPLVTDDTFDVDENQILDFTAADLIANDIDPNGDPLLVTALSFITGSKLEGNITTGMASGGISTISLNAGTDFDELAEGETYVEDITYTVTDGNKDSMGTITITVTGTNDVPVLTGFN
ncbi:MAG: VCBS domain-containing protein, partial [Emcibacter sp.]|nr:VCBS domain-containing protein [Emcibacter sp.]